MSQNFLQSPKTTVLAVAPKAKCVKDWHLPLPQRYAGGYMYSDRIDGVLHTAAGEKPLPMEVITSKGKPDFAPREEALAELALAPIGALYEVARECRPEEDSQTEVLTYRKVGNSEWLLVNSPRFIGGGFSPIQGE